MRKYVMALAGAGASVLTVVALSAGPAMAATLYTVKNGGNLLFTQVGMLTITDITSGQFVSCSSGSVDITISNGTDLSGTDVGSNSIKNLKSSGCTGPLGITFTMTQVGTWQFNATGVTIGSVTTGTISNIDMKLSGFLCTTEVRGTATATYNNATGVLATSRDGNLLTFNSASCLGVLNTGDVGVLTVTFKENSSPFLQITSQ